MNDYIIKNDSIRQSIDNSRESPEYVRVSLAAAITLRLCPGTFYRDAKLYTLNLLLTYNDGCMARCAYCGLSKSRNLKTSWTQHSFIRVSWPLIRLDEVLKRIKKCPHLERACVSMITHKRAREDTLTIVEAVREEIDEVSGLITPTIINKKWLYKLHEAGADKVGIAIDTATPYLFDKLRGKGVMGPHRWEKYWKTVKEAVDVFGRRNVGIHLIIGLGETEEEAVQTIQKAHDMGALTHLFSFFPEEESMMQNHPQPPIGTYRRVQLARYLINKEISRYDAMEFDDKGRIVSFGVDKRTLEKIINSGRPFMTSGCSSKYRENACNRPYSNSTPFQALIGELRNYPFPPSKKDIEIIKRQLIDYSNTSGKIWIKELMWMKDEI